MRFKDFYKVMDRVNTVLFDEDYNTLATLVVHGNNPAMYHDECKKAHALVEADEYVLANVSLCGVGKEPFIAVVLKKG